MSDFLQLCMEATTIMVAMIILDFGACGQTSAMSTDHLPI